MALSYLHLPFGAAPPSLEFGAFCAVVVIDDKVSDEWRDAISEWLVRSGCLYMCAWGDDCSRWDDSVDHANLSEFDYGEIPDDRFVMTTWHAKETLAEAFWFVAHCAFHPATELPHTVIVDIAPEDRRDELLAAFREAQIAED